MKILIVSDLHCGHAVGLTPPGWQSRGKVGEAQALLWSAYKDIVKRAGPVDWCVCNGDAIDGKGTRSEGTEQITQDRGEQCDMALDCLRTVRAKRYLMTHGTAYHTGPGEDWELRIAEELGAPIGSHEWLEADGVVFDFKHHVGGSQVPHGRHTAIARERLWNALWEDIDGQPRADVVVRSHVHYHSYAGASGWLAMTTPALQGPGSKYGARRCCGTIDFGAVIFECKKGEYTWRADIARVSKLAPEVIK